jgi:hypothetical protein
MFPVLKDLPGRLVVAVVPDFGKPVVLNIAEFFLFVIPPG